MASASVRATRHGPRGPESDRGPLFRTPAYLRHRRSIAPNWGGSEHNGRRRQVLRVSLRRAVARRPAGTRETRDERL